MIIEAFTNLLLRSGKRPVFTINCRTHFSKSSLFVRTKTLKYCTYVFQRDILCSEHAHMSDCCESCEFDL